MGCYMNKKSEKIKDAVLVTVGSFIVMAVAFMLYFLMFTIFETMANQDGSYSFVSWIRVGYGIIWIVLCLIIYRTRIPEWLKAGILAGSLTTFMAGIGVQLYKAPIIAGLVILLAVGTAIFLLRKMNKKWYHYYAIAISLIAALFYL